MSKCTHHLSVEVRNNVIAEASITSVPANAPSLVVTPNIYRFIVAVEECHQAIAGWIFMNPDLLRNDFEVWVRFYQYVTTSLPVVKLLNENNRLHRLAAHMCELTAKIRIPNRSPTQIFRSVQELRVAIEGFIPKPTESTPSNE